MHGRGLWFAWPFQFASWCSAMHSLPQYLTACTWNIAWDPWHTNCLVFFQTSQFHSLYE